MKIRFFVLLLTVIPFVTSCTSSNKRDPSSAGPFTIEKTTIEKFTFDFDLKIEAPGGLYASELAAPSMDGTIMLRDAVNIQTPVIDSYTQMPSTDINGAPLMQTKTYAKGTVLNPALNSSDNILIPKDVTITYKKIATDQLVSGRFAYYGTAPRFESENLEMTASKMSRSLRVKAWVTNDLIKNYEFILLNRFKGFHEAFSKPTMHFLKLKSLKETAKNAMSDSKKKWYQAASFYENTLAEQAGLNIYDPYADDATYKNTMLTSILRVLMNSKTMTIEEGLALHKQYSSVSFASKRQKNSTELFKYHLGDRFTLTLPDKAKPDRLGYLTFVYPIAIDRDGPFKLPAPGLRQFPLSISIEARWWSNRWEDEFGGFPFLQITYDGVAFHGPISLMKSDTETTWFLKRDAVSHSCMRMDASDLLELRALIPKNMAELQKLKKTISLVIQEWPDVTDIDNNGTFEVADVAYYKVPENLGQVTNIENWKPTVANKTFWNEAYKPHVGLLPSGNTFKILTTSTMDPVTKKVISTTNQGVFTGLPKYDIIKNETVIVGYHQETPIMALPHRPTAIIQYTEDGVVIKNGLNPNDNRGKYPPSYFNKL